MSGQYLLCLLFLVYSFRCVQRGGVGLYIRILLHSAVKKELASKKWVKFCLTKAPIDVSGVKRGKNLAPRDFSSRVLSSKRIHCGTKTKLKEE